jgi:hypothetical protein
LRAWAIGAAATALQLGARQRAIAIGVHGTEHGIGHDAQLRQRDFAIEVRINEAEARRLVGFHAFAHALRRATAFATAGGVESAGFLKRQATILIGINFRETRGKPSIGFFTRHLAVIIRVSAGKSLASGKPHHAISTLAVMHLVHVMGRRALRAGAWCGLSAGEPRRAKGENRSEHKGT